MQQPRFSSPLSSSSSPPNQQEKDRESTTTTTNNGITPGGGGGGGVSPPKKNQNQNQSQLLPTPQELVAHYESQGMETQQASFKVIDDLQNVLIRVVSSQRGKKEKVMTDISKKLDTANTRLAILESKVDSKPGFFQALGIGVATSAAWPHIAAGAANIWTTVRGITKQPNSK